MGVLDRLKRYMEHSIAHADGINRLIKEEPYLFLDMFSAKKDDLSDRNIDQFINSLFPDLQTNLRLERERSLKFLRNSSRNGPDSFYDGGREREGFLDGDPREEDPVELLKLREPISEFLSTGIYGKYNKSRRSWEQIGFPISQKHFGGTREVTAELPVTKKMKKIILPKCLNATILPERVKGVKPDGEEVSLTVVLNNLGEARVDIPEGMEKIVYSQTVQDLPGVPADVSMSEYDNFKRSYEKRFGLEISEKIAILPEELKIFIESIKDKTPIEKIESIEEFVREVGFYDFDNAEAQDLKKYKGIEEVIAIMNHRMKEIRRKNPKDVAKMGGKKYAGVCSDFAKLSSALMREAGIISGMVGGLQPDGVNKTITTKSAHAVSFALFPEENSKSVCVPIDATPSGIDENEERILSGIRRKSLKERRREFESKKDKINEEAEKMLVDLEKLVSNIDEDGIKRLRNGQLEKALNAILRQVRESHLAVVDRVLNASRYAGFDVSKIVNNGDINEELAVRNFLESEIASERNIKKGNTPFKGENLLQSIEDFISRYEKDGGTGGKKKAFDIVEKIFDISKKYLNPVESRSAIAVITYLRSEHMTK